MPGWKAIPLALVASLLCMFIGFNVMGYAAALPIPAELVLLFLPISALILFTVLHSERLWVYLAIGSFCFSIVADTEGIGASEILFAGVVLFGMIVWFAKETLLSRRTILRSGFDVLLMGFWLVSTAVSIYATVVHNGPVDKYITELSYASSMLFYFPLRNVLHNREDIVRLLFIFLAIGLMNGALNILTYRQRLVESVAEYGVANARATVNEPTSIAMLILCTTALAYFKKFRHTIIALVGVMASIVFLVLSLSRGPIFSGLFGIAILTILIPFRKGQKVIVALLIAISTSVVSVYIAFPAVAQGVTESISKRLSTVSSVGSDPSLNARIAESGTVLNKYIPESPLIGYGYGVTYSFRDPLSRATTTRAFLHNGYVRPAFKHGLPLSLMFLGVLVYPLVRLLIRAPGRKDNFLRGSMAGAVSFICAGALVNFTSEQFGAFGTVFNFVVCWALLDYVNNSIQSSANRTEIWKKFKRRTTRSAGT